VGYMRLFWAINLPTDLKSNIYNQISSPLSSIPADLKWVEEKNLHLTLKFLGDVETCRVEEIFKSVKSEVGRFGSLHFEVRGVGCFPGRKRPRVFWAGIQGQTDELRKLHDRTRQALSTLGFKSGNKKFSPHITLARFRSHSNSAKFMHMAEELVPPTRKLGSFDIVSIELMQSTLSRRGPEYNILNQVLL